MSLFRLDTTGSIPVVANDTVLYSTAGIHSKDISIERSASGIILQTMITTFVFLFIIIWFTLIFNISTKGYNDSDYYLFQFAVYFSIFAFIIIYILLILKSYL